MRAHVTEGLSDEPPCQSSGPHRRSFAVAAGSFVAGIPGALFAVPLVAVVNVMTKYIASGDWRTNPRPTRNDVLGNGK